VILARDRKRPYREWMTFVAFVAPNLLLLAVFAYWPLIQNFMLSFTEWDMISPDKRFVGLQNWISVLTSTRFWSIAANTAIFTVGSVGLTLLIGLALALLLNQPLRFRNAARTVVFTPTVLSGAAVVGCTLAVLGCVELGGVSWPRYVEREEKRVSVTGRPDLTLSTFDGSVEIGGWDRSDVVVPVGGTIPAYDVTELKDLGVAEVFTPGASTQEAIDFIRGAVRS